MSKMSITYKEYGVISSGGDLVIDLPVGCPLCQDGVRPGHFACYPTPGDLVNDETIEIVYDNGVWVAIWHPYRNPKEADKYVSNI